MSGCSRVKEQGEKIDEMAISNFVSGFLIGELEGYSREFAVRVMDQIMDQIRENVLENFPEIGDAAQEKLLLNGSENALCPMTKTAMDCAINCHGEGVCREQFYG